MCRLFWYDTEESATPWEEMYRVFNMGQRMEIYLEEDDAQAIIDISKNIRLMRE